MSCVIITATPAGQRSASNYLYKPATCKRGLHSLAETGYSHTDNDENVLRIIYRSAWPNRIPDHTWRLSATPPAPAAAELDDSVYCDIEPQFQARPIPPQPIPPQPQGTRRVDEPANQSTGSSPVGSPRQS